jgi:hypothetical protein
MGVVVAAKGQEVMSSYLWDEKKCRKAQLGPKLVACAEGRGLRFGVQGVP